MRYITFALAKGRLAKKAMALLEEIGITCKEMKDEKTRKLIFVNEELKLKFFLSKASDVPTYVVLLTQARNRRKQSITIFTRSMLTVTEPCLKETVSIEELHHRKLPSMPYKCLTVPNLTDCNVCLTISHTTRSIICQREASA